MYFESWEKNVYTRDHLYFEFGLSCGLILQICKLSTYTATPEFDNLNCIENWRTNNNVCVPFIILICSCLRMWKVINCLQHGICKGYGYCSNAVK